MNEETIMRNLFSRFEAIFFFALILATFPTVCHGQINTKSKITLLSFNVWGGGKNVSDGQSKVLNAVLTSGADIVGISEAAAGIGTLLADKLGWYSYITNDNDIISRFPIKQTWNSTKGVGATIEIENGRIIAVITVHLYYTPYGPYRACLDGASVGQIISEETSSGRMGEINAALHSIDTYLKNGTPTFLMGDLNTPSHLDWISSTANNHCGYIVQWPVTKAIEDSGMLDSYREAFPDPEVSPGITWSPIYKTYVYGNGKPEPMDRIDFIYSRGDSIKTQSSKILTIGTPEQIPNQWHNEWPSDHSAVVSGFSIETGAEVRGSPEAKFYASTPVILQGNSISYTDISTNNPTSWSWSFEGGTPATSTVQNPNVAYLNAGNYSVTLVATNAKGSDTTTVTGLITVKSGISLVDVFTDRTIYNRDESIAVSFRNGPGNPKDWIGIYTVGDIPGPTPSTLWLYLNGRQSATDSINNGTVTFATGLHTEGNYWVGLFEDDGYNLLKADSFKVKEGQPRVMTNKRRYNIGDSIIVSFKYGPRNPTDWIGIYKVGDIPGPTSSTLWFYVNGTQSPSDSIGNGKVTFTQGLSNAGMYWTGFFENGGYTLLDSTGFAVGNLTDIEAQHNDLQIPKILALQIYPNPFNPVSTISYSIPRSEMVTLHVYDALGRTVATLVNEIRHQGSYEVHFDGNNLASGIYLCRIKMGNETLTRKMLLMK
jgi:PKD repeat protein